MSPLNDEAPQNISYIVVTPETSHAPMAWLNAKAEAKVQEKLNEPRRAAPVPGDGTLATRVGAWLEGSVASLSASMQASQTANVPQTSEDEILESELAHVSRRRSAGGADPGDRDASTRTEAPAAPGAACV